MGQRYRPQNSITNENSILYRDGVIVQELSKRYHHNNKTISCVLKEYVEQNQRKNCMRKILYKVSARLHFSLDVCIVEMI